MKTLNHLLTLIIGACVLFGAVLAAKADGLPTAVDGQVRVATLLPFVEDALAQTPGDFVVVATVRRSLHSPPRKDVADLGNPHAPSLEALAVAQPDLIIGDQAVHRMVKDDIQGRDFGRGVPEVLLIDSSSVDATLGSLIEISKKVGAEAPMKAATENTQAGIAAVALAEPVSTLALFGTPGHFMVMSERTWLGDLLADLHFQNVAPKTGGDERFPGLVEVNDEILATMRPELVLLVAHGDPQAVRADLERRIDKGGPWAGVRDSASRGVHVLPAQTFSSNPGLALDGAAKELVQLADDPTPAVSAPGR